MKIQKKLLAKNKRYSDLTRRSIDKLRPIYAQLCEKLDDAHVSIESPKIVNELTEFYIRDIKHLGLSNHKLLEMVEKSNDIAFVENALESLTKEAPLEVYATPKALEKFIEEKHFVYTSDPELIKVVDDMEGMMKTMERYHIKEPNMFSIYGWLKVEQEWHLYTLERHWSQIKAMKERYKEVAV